MMPSGRKGEYGQGEVEADFVFNNIIEPAINAVLGSGSADRESDSLEPGAITPKIIQKLNEYDFAIVDITGGNPNVFFELGVRHSLRRKTTIILRQKTTAIPFDIGNYRVLDYTPFKFEEARNSLEEIIRRSIGDKSGNDSSVVDVLGDYDIVFKAKTSQDRMLWEYYFKTIERISRILKAAHEEKDPQKKYSPDAIIGISNGGMIFADYLHRSSIYKPEECQFVSLWANRDRPGRYFTYKSNELLLEGLIKDTNKAPSDVRLLLVDDNVSGGDTSKLAIQFIKNYSNDIHVRFLPMFFNREDILPRIYDHLLWSHHAFRYPERDITNLHFVNYRYFPYDKSISGR
jgi:hypoxanthine phosphoribosyltransferase